MIRRALALVLLCMVLLVGTVLSVLWFSDVPGVLKASLSTGLVVVTVASLLAGLPVARRLSSGAREVRSRERQVDRRLRELESPPVPGPAADEPIRVASTAWSSSPEGPGAVTVTGTVEQAIADRRIEERLHHLEASGGELRNAGRSHAVWAHEIESAIRARKVHTDEVADGVRRARSADHDRLADLELALYDLALRTGTAPGTVLDERRARELASRLARGSDYLRVKSLLEDFDVLDEIPAERLPAALKTYRRLGYLEAQARIAQELIDRGVPGVDPERLAMHIEEWDFFRDPKAGLPALPPEAGIHDPSGPVVHVVGKSVPETQSGYTLRTQYTVRAQQRRGIDVVVLCQAGAPGGDPERTVEHVVDGVRCLIVAGPARFTTTYVDWLAVTVAHSAAEVRALRPSILHAHSDFLNALVATVIGRAYGIPVVYESRGFWEESWLSRTKAARAEAGEDADFDAVHGMPEAYALRRLAEADARESVDANVTLGRTMRAHIRDLAHPGSLDVDPIPLVPNGVEIRNFPRPTRDEELAASLGIAPGEVVIGCISSIVEYEGIDLLVRAHRRLVSDGVRARLLIVGDGVRLESLRDLAGTLGTNDAIFTGRVPHEEVLRYYGLLDIFVVPRRPVPVSRLVTPLKPFEALATGRALVVSDVEALREIAEDAAGAVAVFRAGDERDLARVLADLVADPARRAALGEQGSRWVAEERTWDANVGVYEEVYRRLGARTSEHRTRSRGTPIAAQPDG